MNDKALWAICPQCEKQRRVIDRGKDSQKMSPHRRYDETQREMVPCMGSYGPLGRVTEWSGKRTDAGKERGKYNVRAGAEDVSSNPGRKGNGRMDAGSNAG